MINNYTVSERTAVLLEIQNDLTGIYDRLLNFATERYGATEGVEYINQYILDDWSHLSERVADFIGHTVSDSLKQNKTAL